jgi:hypothetical protein
MRGYEIGKMARERGAYVIFGGIHATLYPEEARQLGGAQAVVKRDVRVGWSGNTEHVQTSFSDPVCQLPAEQSARLLRSVTANWGLLAPAARRQAFRDRDAQTLDHHEEWRGLGRDGPTRHP